MGRHNATVIIGGELDYATAPILTARLRRVIAGQPERLILDMARVIFIDCAGLSLIVQARNRLPAGASLIVRSPSAGVRRLFRLASLEQVCALQEAQPR